MLGWPSHAYTYAQIDTMNRAIGKQCITITPRLLRRTRLGSFISTNQKELPDRSAIYPASSSVNAGYQLTWTLLIKANWSVKAIFPNIRSDLWVRLSRHKGSLTRAQSCGKATTLTSVCIIPCSKYACNNEPEPVGSYHTQCFRQPQKISIVGKGEKTLKCS